MLAHFGHHLLAALLMPLLPFIRDDFALDYTQAGWVVSAFTLSYGISQLPAGWLADRIGPRKVITMGISGVALAGLLVGLSPTYVMMMVFLVLLGAMGGGYHPSAVPLLAAAVEPKNRGRVLGFHQIGGTSSFFLAPLIAATVANALGWRGSFIVLSIPLIVFGIIFYVVISRWGDIREAVHEMPNGHAETLPTTGGWRRLAAVLTLSITGDVLIFSTISFIPLFLVDHFSVTEETAAALLSLVFSAGLWAGPLGGYLSDRLGKVPLILVVSLIAGPVIYLLGLAPFGMSIFAVLLISGVVMFIRMPVSEAYIVSQTSERNRSTILGIYYFSSRGGPGLVMPVMGYLFDQYGFSTSFTIVGATMVAVTIVCSIFLWRSRTLTRNAR